MTGLHEFLFELVDGGFVSFGIDVRGGSIEFCNGEIGPILAYFDPIDHYRETRLPGEASNFPPSKPVFEFEVVITLKCGRESDPIVCDGFCSVLVTALGCGVGQPRPRVIRPHLLELLSIFHYGLGAVFFRQGLDRARYFFVHSLFCPRCVVDWSKCQFQAH